MAARFSYLSRTCVPRALALSAALVACGSPGDSKPGELEHDAAPASAGDGDQGALRRDASVGVDAGVPRDGGMRGTPAMRSTRVTSSSTRAQPRMPARRQPLRRTSCSSWPTTSA